MIKLLIEQGSEAWFKARLGRITGTRFNALMMTDSTAGYKDLVANIACEMISGEFDEQFKSTLMERGNEVEGEARDFYADLFGVVVEEVGIIYPDEDNEFHEWVGVSPDGMTDGLQEFKCPLRRTHLNYILKDELPKEYKWQVYGLLFVTGLPYCDFMSYFPDMKPFVVRVLPDEKIFEEIANRLRVTITKIKETLEIYKNYNYER